MKKITLLLIGFIITTSGFSQILSENFNDITTLAGWDRINVSTTIGTTNYFQGNPGVIEAYEGPTDSYIGANFNATTGANTISNWLILPVLSLKDGDILTFYTRTMTASNFPDRLQVRISANGAASTAPTGPSDLGSYTTLLADINQFLAVGGYPETWTLQTITISGLGATAVDARLALRYFVADGGPAGNNSNYIGIDSLTVTDALGVDEFNSYSFSHFYDKNSDVLTLKSEVSPLSEVEIYSLLGQRVMAKNLSNTSESLSLSTLQDGVYLVKVSIEGNSKTFKVLKQ